MATYSNTVVSQTSVSSTSSGTQYTVPAGKYAEIYFSEINAQAAGGWQISLGGNVVFSGSNSALNYPSSSLVSGPSQAIDEYFSTVITLFSGDTVAVTGDTVLVEARVNEFSNP